MAAGSLLLAAAPDHASYVTDLLPGFLAVGLGVGLVFPAASVTTMSDVDDARSGLASGLMSTGHEVGAALGVADLLSRGDGSVELRRRLRRWLPGSGRAGRRPGPRSPCGSPGGASERRGPAGGALTPGYGGAGMAQAAIDHRRATAERNLAAILDATERLLARHAPATSPP